jgi:NADH:ubiquinone oxidoreductase subunit H
VKEERKGRSIHVVAGVEAFGWADTFDRERVCNRNSPFLFYSPFLFFFFFRLFFFWRLPRLRMDEWMERGGAVAAEQ